MTAARLRKMASRRWRCDGCLCRDNERHRRPTCWREGWHLFCIARGDS